MEKVEKIKNPKITVVTPTYNRANFIIETIESVLNQDFKDFEYLILDDGSTDNTEEIIKPYLKDKRVQYLKQANAGEAETVNWGWNLARGEYFTQVNSDDPILPKLFSVMVNCLDKKKDVIVAYPDFYFIDESGKIIKKNKTPDWNFINALSNYSCYASSAGTFIRKTAFGDLKKIKNSKYRHISDNDMYWRMALRGKFFHVSKFLATWKVHSESISVERYKSIPEIQNWYEEYFSQENLPNEVKEIKEKVRDSICKYCIDLIGKSVLTNKSNLITEFYNIFYKSNILQIGDNDLIGNKFNGHDLHFYLNKNGLKTKHLVWNKESFDAETFEIARNKLNRKEIFNYTKLIQSQYSTNGLLNPLWYDVLYDPLFLNSDLIHFHLIHNGLVDLQLLPLMSRLKPIVWTLHDPWAFSGKYIEELEDSALSFELKKTAIQNSKIEVIVASKFMLNQIKESCIFKDKSIHLIPFGINQNIFKRLDKVDIRKKFNIPLDSLVISFRSDNRYRKGVDYVEYVIENLKTDKDVYFISFGGGSFCKKNIFKYIEFGWIKDDLLMADIYNASDIFLMPSTLEAFGMMAIESMSCGIMPFVLDGTSLPEVVDSPNCGISVKRDKKEYLRIVQYFIDNEKERNDRADKCLEFAKDKYNCDIYVKKIINVYNEAKNKFKISNEDIQLINQLKMHSIFELNNKADEVVSHYGIAFKFKYFLKKILKYLFLKSKKYIPLKYKDFMKKKFSCIYNKIYIWN